MPTIYELIENKTIKELKPLCKKNKIKNYSKMKKKELVDVLYNNYMELYKNKVSIETRDDIFKNVYNIFNDILNDEIKLMYKLEMRENKYINSYNIEDIIADEDGEVMWYLVSLNLHLTEETIEKYKDELWWDEICRTYKSISIDFIEKYKDYTYMEWREISLNHNLSEDIIDKYKDELYWWELSKNPYLSLRMIEKYKYKIDEEEQLYWDNIALYNYHLNNDFIDKYKDKFLKNKLTKSYLDRNDYLNEKVFDVDEEKKYIEKFKKITYENITDDFVGVVMVNASYRTKKYMIEKYIDKINIRNLFYRYSHYTSSQLYAYQRIIQKKQINLIKDELIEIAYCPDRVVDWCMSECEKKRIKKYFKNDKPRTFMIRVKRNRRKPKNI